MSFTDITIQEYTSRSIVVQGDTRKYKEDLKKLGGKYNGRLANGPGWIFSKAKEGDIISFIKKGKRLVTAEEAKEGEERSRQKAKEWEQSRSRQVKKVSSSQNNLSISQSSPTLSEHGALISSVNNIAVKIERIEHAIMFLLNADQKKQLKVLMNPPAKKMVKKVIKRRGVARLTEVIDSDDSDNDSSSDDDEPPRRRLLRK